MFLHGTYNMSISLVSRKEGDPAGGDPAHVRVKRCGTVEQRLLRLFRIPHTCLAFRATGSQHRAGRGCALALRHGGKVADAAVQH